MRVRQFARSSLSCARMLSSIMGASARMSAGTEHRRAEEAPRLLALHRRWWEQAAEEERCTGASYQTRSPSLQRTWAIHGPSMAHSTAGLTMRTSSILPSYQPCPPKWRRTAVWSGGGSGGGGSGGGTPAHIVRTHHEPGS
ncbi:hypothetical protein NFJ02_10g01010 [Pycnococcus provasolii]